MNRFLLNMKLTSMTVRWLGLALLGWLAMSSASGWAADAKPVKLRVQLVWGTNEDKPPGKDMPELDVAIRDKVARHLRWKNYFVVKAEDAASTPKVTRLTLSAQCAVELHEEAGQVVARIFSLKPGAEPKLVCTKTMALADLLAGKTLAFGGDSKDNWDDAWLLVIRLAP